MRISRQPSRAARLLTGVFGAALLLALPAAAHAQYGAPELSSSTIGENYHIEAAGSLWTPDVFGQISSEQFGIIGSKVDFVDDLGFEKTRFKDFRLVLRPSKKTKFRIQHTPVSYMAETSLKREFVFNGQTYPVALPLQSQFDWNVWRLGIEYDAFYRPRGYVGFLIEARYTEMYAELRSPVRPTEFRREKAPLPAIGIVGRAYPLPALAINFEMSTFNVPKDTIPNIEANYYDWDINGTFNVSRYLGVEVGWRRMTNYLSIKKDVGDTKFQGMYFGGALRY
jgi:hypothetical protein